MALVTTLLTGIGVGQDISGPSSSTDNAIARWNGTTGNTLQDSGILIDDSDNITGASSIELAGTEIYAASATLSNANLKAMYDTPVEIAAAAGANKAIVVHRAFLQHEFGTAAFTGGGSIVFQYGNTANGAGTQSTDNLSSSILTTAADTGQMQDGQIPVSAKTVYSNVGIFISNDTAAFADGDGTATFEIWYSIIDV